MPDAVSRHPVPQQIQILCLLITMRCWDRQESTCRLNPCRLGHVRARPQRYLPSNAFCTDRPLRRQITGIISKRTIRSLDATHLHIHCSIWLKPSRRDWHGSVPAPLSLQATVITMSSGTLMEACSQTVSWPLVFD